MNALAGESAYFANVQIESDNTQGLKFTFHGDSGGLLPSMEDWMPGAYWATEPWWDRDDASTLDLIPPDGTEPSDVPVWAFNLDFITNAVLGNVNAPVTDGTNIIRAPFKPTIIDGGKPE
jgi:hypothetical protein